MVLSKQTFETILDLIENKMSCMEGWDQATARERAKLEGCRRELISLNEPKEPQDLAEIGLNEDRERHQA
jgi:hypothetical protein